MLGNWDGFLPLSKVRYHMRRALNISWSGRILLRGCGITEREFTETVDTAEGGGTVVNKVGGILCVMTGRVTLG